METGSSNISNKSNVNTSFIIGIVIVLVIAYFTIKKMSPSILNNLTKNSNAPVDKPQDVEEKKHKTYEYYD